MNDVLVMLGGGYGQVVKDGPTALGVEAGALQAWAYGPDDLAQIQQPTLAVSHLDPRFGIFDDFQCMLVEHIPHVKGVVLSGITHLLPIVDARAVAERLTPSWRPIRWSMLLFLDPSQVS